MARVDIAALGFFPSRSEYPVGFGSDYPVTSSTKNFWSLAVFLRVSFRSEYPVGFGSDYPVSTSTKNKGESLVFCFHFSLGFSCVIFVRLSHSLSTAFR